MYFDNLRKVQLYNRLLKLECDSFSLCDYGFETHPDAPALQLSAAAVLFYLQPRDFAWIKTLPQFEAWPDPKSLDPALKLAALESMLQKPLSRLSELCDAAISVSGYKTGFSAKNFKQAFSFELKIVGCIIPCTLYAHNQDALQALLEKAVQLEQRLKPDVAQVDPYATVSIAAGTLSFTLREWRTLKSGDAIVFDSYPAADDELLLCAGELRTRAKADNDTLTLLNGFERRQGNAMSDVNVPDADHQDLTSPEDILLEGIVELDRQSISLKELSAMTEGSVLPLKTRDLSDVALCINGRCAARGRIIEAGGTFAFQITRLPSHD